MFIPNVKLTIWQRIKLWWYRLRNPTLDFKTIAIPITLTPWPKLSAKDIVSVQPMTEVREKEEEKGH